MPLACRATLGSLGATDPLTVATAALPSGAMSTRRWVGELESWLRRSDLSKDELVKRSDHSAAQVLSLFEQSEPNPTLRVYLELVHKAGARFNGVINNEPAEVITRLKEIMVRENIATVSALAKVADVNRSQLSRMFNDPAPNPTLAVFDRLVVGLGADRRLLRDRGFLQRHHGLPRGVRCARGRVPGRHPRRRR